MYVLNNLGLYHWTRVFYDISFVSIQLFTHTYHKYHY